MGVTKTHPDLNYLKDTNFQIHWSLLNIKMFLINNSFKNRMFLFYSISKVFLLFKCFKLAYFHKFLNSLFRPFSALSCLLLYRRRNNELHCNDLQLTLWSVVQEGHWMRILKTDSLEKTCYWQPERKLVTLRLSNISV